MQLPFPILTGLNTEAVENFKVRFSSEGGWNRAVRENVWRRHQAPVNAEQSGWVCTEDARRRILYFRDEYALEGDSFVIKDAYLFLNIKGPEDEVTVYRDALIDSLDRGDWQTWSSDNLWCRGDLNLVMQTFKASQYDIENDTPNPAHYRSLEIWVHQRGKQPDMDRYERPWKILKTGIRQVPPRGKPTKITALKPFLPAQVELGCGPSIDAGIPPLNYMHGIYSITTPDKKFVLKAGDDTFIQSYFGDVEGHYKKAAYIHAACLQARPNKFYRDLKFLHDRGDIVGPVLTNNFDGLALSVGLPEYSLRQHDATGIYPKPPLDPRAKSLFVIGSHADRRKATAYAREAGLKIVFIDPEGYLIDAEKDEMGYPIKGTFVPYPLEAPQDGDFIMHGHSANALDPLL